MISIKPNEGAVPRPLRVTVVEDSPTAAAATCDLLIEAGFTVAGTAASVERAEALVRAERPDLVLSDVHLTDGDGIELTRRLLRERGVPIVLITAFDAGDRDLVFRAMEAGALEVLPKPPPRAAPSFGTYRRRFELTLRSLAGVPVIRRRGEVLAPAAPRPEDRRPPLAVGAEPLIALGASTGGPVIVADLLKVLATRRFGAALVAQHIVPEFVESFRGWLAQCSGLPVRIARDGEPLADRTTYLAPGGCHLGVDSSARLRVAPGSGHPAAHVPSIDELFETLAESQARRTVAVLLSGMGEDGARGLARLREAGARTIAQAPATAAVDSMPRTAIELDAAAEVLAPEAIAELFSRLPPARGSRCP